MRKVRWLPRQPTALAGLLLIGLLAACTGATGPSAPAPRGAPGESFTGLASWYGARFHGRLTASGSRYDMTALTAAHRSLAFGTKLRVTHLANQRSVVVVVNDRGPFIKGRVIDLSRAAAERLGFIESGLAEVRVDILAQAPP